MVEQAQAWLAKVRSAETQQHKEHCAEMAEVQACWKKCHDLSQQEENNEHRSPSGRSPAAADGAAPHSPGGASGAAGQPLLVVGSVAGSGAAGVLGELHMVLQLRQCPDASTARPPEIGMSCSSFAAAE